MKAANSNVINRPPGAASNPENEQAVAVGANKFYRIFSDAERKKKLRGMRQKFADREEIPGFHIDVGGVNFIKVDTTDEEYTTTLRKMCKAPGMSKLLGTSSSRGQRAFNFDASEEGSAAAILLARLWATRTKLLLDVALEYIGSEVGTATWEVATVVNLIGERCAPLVKELGEYIEGAGEESLPGQQRRALRTLRDCPKELVERCRDENFSGNKITPVKQPSQRKKNANQRKKRR
eukprot:g14204.t1